MDVVRLNPDVVRLTTEALTAFARHLTQAGHPEIAHRLIHQAAEFELMSPDLQNCWGGPFNGQQGRAKIIEQLLIALKPAAIIETGTYRGISTRWFADNFSGPVWSCEKEEVYLIQARRRLEQCKNVHLALADSRAFLRELIPTLDADRPNLFYLDAHWERDLPLHDELQIIFGAQPKAVVLVDDFRVPDDPGYGWDDYGPGRVVDASQLTDAIQPEASIYFPTLPSSEETGARRGCSVIAFESRNELDSCSLLKRCSLGDIVSIDRPVTEGDTENRRLHDIMLAGEDHGEFVDRRVVEALRQEVRQLSLAAAYRLNDVNFLTERAAALQAEVDLLKPERGLLLNQIESLTTQLSISQDACAERLALIESLEAELKQHIHTCAEAKNEISQKADSAMEFGSCAINPELVEGAAAIANSISSPILGQSQTISKENLPHGDGVGLVAIESTENTRSLYHRALRFYADSRGPTAPLWRRAARRLVRAARANARTALDIVRPRRKRTYDTLAVTDAIDTLAVTDAIDLVYRSVLGRPTEPGVLANRVEALRAGFPFMDMFVEIATSEEAKLRAARQNESPKDSPSNWQLSPDQSDGEFLLTGGSLAYGRGLSPREIAAWQAIIDEIPGRRIDFVTAMINEHIRKSCVVDASAAALNDPTTTEILGTTQLLTQPVWDARRAEMLPARRTRDSSVVQIGVAGNKAFQHSGIYKVSMIASLYKGGKFIRRFLDNLTSQSIFDQAELIIIDANSPEREQEVIEEYQRHYPNIIYERIGYRLGIYDAWNVGLERARGRYLTNTNLDDLRRHDSIALQSAFLDRHNDVDIVYQDFYYTFDPFLSFEEVSAVGFKSELPIIAPHNLLLSNSPHNAPMWRASLHNDVGKFDTSYRSAGDWEFWLRCLEAGKRFRKINTPHVVYYQNPDGISTRPGTVGITEGGRIFNLHSPRLISPALLQSRQDFRSGLGRDIPDGRIGDKTPYFDVAQNALLSLGAERLATAARTGIETLEGLDRNERASLRVLVDGVVFQWGRAEIARLWLGLLRKLVLMDGISLFMLDRGNSPLLDGVKLLEFPSYTQKYTATDSLLIQEFCDTLEIDVFTSSFYTSVTTTPQVQIVYDMMPELLENGTSRRIWKEKQLALNYASHLACTSESTRDNLLRVYPNIHSSRISIAEYGVDAAIFNPAAARNLSKFRAAHDLKRPYVLWAGLHEQLEDDTCNRLMVDALKLDQAADFDVVCLGTQRSMDPGGWRSLRRGMAVRLLTLNDADLATAYSGAIALVCPSLHEGFGWSAIEAQACGCPIIMTTNGLIEEVTAEGATTLSARNGRELTRALEDIRAPKLRRQLIEAGLARVAEFSLDRSMLQFVGHLQQVAQRRRHPDEDEFHRRWHKLRISQSNVDIGLD
jgi:glycosyltransferase involved in cell wall biosynthesis/predicted O-methyltransferase YrrM